MNAVDDGDPPSQEPPTTEVNVVDDGDPPSQEPSTAEVNSADDGDPPSQEPPTTEVNAADDGDPPPQEPPTTEVNVVDDGDPPSQEPSTAEVNVVDDGDPPSQEPSTAEVNAADDGDPPLQEPPTTEVNVVDDGDPPLQESPVSNQSSSDKEEYKRYETEQDTVKGQRSPRKIGARRSIHKSGPLRSCNGVSVSPFTPKPELRCRQPLGSQHWEIFLSVPQECDIKSVHHDETELFAQNGEYRPLTFSGILVIVYDDDTKDEIPLYDRTCLIFKLQKDWQGDGRKTSAITQGHFIVFVPIEYTRVGVALVEADKCIDTNYLAHYFFNSQDTQAGTLGGFEEFDVPSTQAGYALCGEVIHDDSEDGGLFVGTIPRLVPAKGIVWARVGEEKTNGWQGENFNPTDKTLKDVLGERHGRFYVRVYNESVRLIDSGEFRYIASLKKIVINGVPYSRKMLVAPTPCGHSPSTLQFIANDGATIGAKLKTATPFVTVGSDGTAKIAPHPNGDETTWVIDGVDVVIKLPRLWWRIVLPDRDPVCWGDKPMRLSRDEFRSLSHANLEVRVPAFIRDVQAGFKRLDQKFPVENDRSNLRRVSLPIAAFVDYEEIDKPLTGDVGLKIRCGEVEIVLIDITSEHQKLTMLCSNTSNAVQESPQFTKGLRAHVKCSSGRMRYGRGFSCGELQAAGISKAEAVSMSLTVDMRRRSMHSLNIESLKEVERNA